MPNDEPSRTRAERRLAGSVERGPIALFEITLPPPSIRSHSHLLSYYDQLTVYELILAWTELT